MSRRGAIKITFKSDVEVNELMASVGFLPWSSSQDDKLSYFRYSDRAMETIVTKFAFLAPPSEKGDRQRKKKNLL
jgi:hypothetical protein